MTALVPDSRHLVYGIAGSLVAYALVKYSASRWTPKGTRWAPGPGLLGFPSERWLENFSEMQKKYGDIIYIDLMGTPFMVLSSLEDAEELASKRAQNYSRRPIHVIVTIMMDFGWSLLMRQPGKDLNEQRKLFRKGIGPQTVSQFDPLMEHEAERLVASLSGHAGHLDKVMEMAVSAVVLKVAYGEKIHREHGEELADLNKTNMQHTTPIFTTFYAVVAFPWLRYIPAWFPGTGFHEVARKGKILTRRVRDWAWGILEKDLVAGTADLSLASQYFNSNDLSTQNLKEAVSVLYGAGVDTTVTACMVVLWKVTTYPAVQRRLQQEIDEVVGHGHLPTAAQSKNLEYLQAVWRESMRLHPAAPFGLPHVAAQADSYKGYYIPKETMINCNIAFMLRDPRVWGPDADEFRPERFLGEEAKELPDIASVPFGFGNRICPGRYLADRLGSVFIASILSTYDVVPIDGEVIPDPLPFEDGAIRRPSAFRCQFKPRH